MTSLKFVLMAALTLTFASPAFALTKGSKSYQSASKSTTETTTTASNTATETDVTKIEPAAGAQTPDQPKADEGKSFKEEMRLPRKN